MNVVPTWLGNDEVVLPLVPSSDRSLVLFKESVFPGWSARLENPGGSTVVSIVSSEMDFMLVHLDSVPAGSRLVFTYTPTPRLEAWWALSTLALAGLLLWLVRPGAAARPLRWGSGRLSRRRLGSRSAWGVDEE